MRQVGRPDETCYLHNALTAFTVMCGSLGRCAVTRRDNRSGAGPRGHEPAREHGRHYAQGGDGAARFEVPGSVLRQRLYGLRRRAVVAAT